ncbi:MAG: hypothetical protein IIB36_19165 [Gemmatimonadetes bacterium]|nr:hypothetical protein [Gemmatimonadota bacterium]
MQTIPLRTTHVRTLLFIGLAVSLSACWGDAAGLDGNDIIDREVFIAAYVDLRAAALSTDDREITDEARAEVLSRHNTSEADVLNFAEYHARDLPFMRDVWDEIEVLLEDQRPMMDDPGRR